MTFWLDDAGWLRFSPGDPLYSWIGYNEAPPEEEPRAGGFQRIVGYGPGWLDLLTLAGKRSRLTWEEGKFEDTMRLEVL